MFVWIGFIAAHFTDFSHDLVMPGRLRQWVKSTLDGGEDMTEERDPSAGTGTPAELYACPECSKTYIGRDMVTCPTCEAGLDTVPNEQDLGME